MKIKDEPKVHWGRRGNPGACDSCDVIAPENWTSQGWVWSEVEVGPASFAFATCPQCEGTEKHWTEKALKRASRHGKSWAKSVDRMIMRGLP